jgi:hypothetical protein
MKKLLLLLFIGIGLSMSAQQMDVDFNKKYTLPAYTMDGDSSYVFRTFTQMYWDIQFIWATLDQTDGSVKIQISNDGVDYRDYPNLDSLLFDSASGSGGIRDTYKGTASKYLKILVDSGTCTSGTLVINGNLAYKQKR